MIDTRPSASWARASSILPGLSMFCSTPNYDGLAIIELDASKKTAEQSALESIAYIRDTLGLTLTPKPAEKTAA